MSRPDHTMTTCPDCHGEKGAHALVKYASGCQEEWRPCEVCQGTGSVTAARATVTIRGRAYRDRRVALNLSLRELAERLNMSAVNLNTVEHGRAPKDWMERVEAYLTGLEAEAGDLDPRDAGKE